MKKRNHKKMLKEYRCDCDKCGILLVKMKKYKVSPIVQLAVLNNTCLKNKPKEDKKSD